MNFVFEAKKDPASIVKGSVTAETLESAVRKVSGMGYYLLSIDEESAEGRNGSSAFGRFFFRRVGLKPLVGFTRQLSDLLESGLTLVKSLELLSEQTENRHFKAAIVDVRSRCMDGHPLSEALSRHPRLFSNLYTSLVRSGEASGTLEGLLSRLADFQEKQLDIRARIRAALAYPILMTVVGLATIGVLVVFVIPKIMGMFQDLNQTLPLPTMILLNVSLVLTRYAWLWGLLLFLGVSAFLNFYKTERGRVAVDPLKLSLPVAGKLILKIEIARLSNTLATLLSNGVPILDALQIATETVSNRMIRRELEAAHDSVKGGAGLAQSLSGSKIFPKTVLNMIAVGEESGKLEKALFRISEIYDREADNAVKIMVSLLEPALILVLGLAIGFIVVSMLLPIFEISFLGD